MHIAILMTNTDDSDFAARWPRDGEKFTNLLSPLRPDWKFSIYPVKDDVFPEGSAVFDGVIITGSPASVHDTAPWVPRLLKLIRHLHAKGTPMFGACFGHQAIALALGGTVAQNPGGWVFGVVRTEMEGKPLRLYAAHSEQVTVLPKGPRRWAAMRNARSGPFASGSPF